MGRARKFDARWLSLLLRWGAKAAALDPRASAIGQLRWCEPPVVLRNGQCAPEKFSHRCGPVLNAMSEPEIVNLFERFRRNDDLEALRACAVWSHGRLASRPHLSQI